MAGEPDPRENARSYTSASPDEQPPPTDVLEIEPVYEALGHPRRRYLCYTLLEDTEWSLTELATKVAAWENEIPEDEVSDRQREALSVSLYHAHIPKLVDEGVITFDDSIETIMPAEHTEQVLTALEGIGASVDANQEAHARSEMHDEGN